ncbi:MAG: hypothetical protein Q4E01_01920 [Actinomycetaceae bacterium]|nr:hypothetical protein [Actinomycetaceae bacterium]
MHPSLGAALGRGSGVVGSLLNSESKRRLLANHQRLSERKLGQEHARRAFSSYFEMFAQSPSLPNWSDERIFEAVEVSDDFRRQVLNEDGPVIVAMTHSGNWDLAGVYAARQWRPVVTVAEVLKPRELYDYFVEARTALGMKIFPAKHGVFNELREYVRGKRVIVPLLADRDISGSGIEVDFGGEKALVAAGPAALAGQLNAPLFAAYMVRLPGKKTRYRLDARRVAITGDVEADTQAWVSALVPLIQSSLVDWHMMQPLFVADLDAKRLERARERARRLEGEA